LLPERNDAQAALIEFNLAIELEGLGDIAEANASYERAATLFLQTHGERDHWYWVTLSNWADGACRQGDRERADQLFARMSQALPAKPDEKEAYHVARAQEVHGSCLTAQGRPREAIPILEAVERQYLERPYSGVAVDLAYVRQILGSAYVRAGRPRRRAAYSSKPWTNLSLMRRIGSPDNARLMNSRALGSVPARSRRAEEAERQFREVIAQDHGRNLDFTALAHGGLAQLALQRGDATAALRASTEALRVMGTAGGSHNPSNERYLWRIHAQALARTGDLAAARDYAQRALDAYRHHDDPVSAEIAESAAVLEGIDRLAKK
jgi:serine/threonine-protein kinase